RAGDDGGGVGPLSERLGAHEPRWRMGVPRVLDRRLRCALVARRRRRRAQTRLLSRLEGRPRLGAPHVAHPHRLAEGTPMKLDHPRDSTRKGPEPARRLPHAPRRKPVPESAPLVLVSHALCPYVQRAAIVLAEKSVAFERRDIDLANKPDWFLRL